MINPLNFKSLYDQFAFLVYHQCFKVVGVKEDAEDLTQEIFGDVVPLLIEKYRGLSREEMGKILVRSATNRAIDWVRKKSRRAEVSLEEWKETQSCESLTEVNMELEGLLKELKKQEREVLTLRHLLGWTWSDISQRMGLSEIGVRKKESRTMAKLNEKWNRKNRG